MFSLSAMVIMGCVALSLSRPVVLSGARTGRQGRAGRVTDTTGRSRDCCVLCFGMQRGWILFADMGLSEQILLAPAGGMEWDATDPYADYYGPDGGPIDFDSPVDVSGY
jgi:hypothetical protein